MDSQFTAVWACWHVDLNNAAVQWGWTVETRHKPSFQISLTCQVSTRRVKGVEIQSLVQYWITTVCCRSKDHFHWITCTLCTPLVPKVGGHCPPCPPVAPPMYVVVYLHALRNEIVIIYQNVAAKFWPEQCQILITVHFTPPRTLRFHLCLSICLSVCLFVQQGSLV